MREVTTVAELLRQGDSRAEAIGAPERRAMTRGELVVLENHVNYLKEVRLGDPVRVTTQLLEYDSKRLRLFHTMIHAKDGFVAATNEVKAIGFDLNQRRIMSFQPAVQARLQALLAEHRQLLPPPAAGKGITLARS